MEAKDKAPTKTQWDLFVANCIGRGWTVRVLKPRPAYGKHHRLYRRS